MNHKGVEYGGMGLGRCNSMVKSFGTADVPADLMGVMYQLMAVLFSLVFKLYVPQKTGSQNYYPGLVIPLAIPAIPIKSQSTISRPWKVNAKHCLRKVYAPALRPLLLLVDS